MREHTLIERDAAGWRISGLIDFESALLGDPAHELASVGLYLSKGDGACLRDFLQGFGSERALDDCAFPERCLAHALLHRSSHLHRWLTGAPTSLRHAALPDLARFWWSASADS